MDAAAERIKEMLLFVDCKAKSRQDRRAALYAGMNGHVTKPIETEKLLEMIERVLNVLSESFLHLLLWPIFCQLHPNFINVHTVYASEICAHLTKNLLTKRFREYILISTLLAAYPRTACIKFSIIFRPSGVMTDSG